MAGIKTLVVMPLDEPASRKAKSPEVVNAYEILQALLTGAKMEPGLEVTAVAPQGSVLGCDAVSIDPFQMGPSCARSHEMILTAMALSGYMREFDVVHWLAPVPNAVLVHSASGGFSVFTPADTELNPFLSALSSLGRIEAMSLASSEAITQALHPVSFKQPLSGLPRSVVCSVNQDQSAVFDLPSVSIERTHEISKHNPLAVLGPPAASFLDHIVWATRVIASGAIYLHDGSMPESGVFPEGSVVRLENSTHALDAAAGDPALPARLRSWALAYCSPAATAARLRRRYRALALTGNQN